ncbi:hypothetical protein LINPERHAP2_LOCUS33001, partial [Linum perenne]
TIAEINRSDQAVHLELGIPHNPTSIISAIYAKPNPMGRVLIWDELRARAAHETRPWVVLGDFNSISCVDENEGGAPFNPYRAASFIKCIADCGFIDLGYVGPKHTWFRGSIQERLDRGMANMLWRQRFPQAMVKHFPRLCSNHWPLLLNFFGLPKPPKIKRPFRFMISWMAQPDFRRVLRNAWKPNVSMTDNLNKLTPRLQRWNQEVYGHINQRKKALSLHLSDLDTASVNNPSLKN